MIDRPVDLKYLRSAPIPDVVALFETARARPEQLQSQLQDAKLLYGTIEQALRERLHVEHPGKYVVVGHRGYRTNLDGRGIDRVEVVLPPDPGLLPPATHLESEGSDAR